ncbi:MAG: YcbK family protein [Methylocystis sp.]|uniref:YcbK family protein n=1 Tax=Methylocystis sp. TaxID=1911079 RepID=UPI003DA20077
MMMAAASDQARQIALVGIARNLARAVGNDAQNDVEEFSSERIGPAFDATVFGADTARNLTALQGLFGNAEVAGFDYAGFDSFIRALGLRYFEPIEFLYLGAGNQSGRCANTNELPPREKWPNLANTALMLDEIRRRLAAPIRILSAYRSDAYNRCVSGASESRHKSFNAIDWTCASGSASEWRDVARQVRASDGRFTGGIGYYPDKNFIHIDTRGYVADW